MGKNFPFKGIHDFLVFNFFRTLFNNHSKLGYLQVNLGILVVLTSYVPISTLVLIRKKKKKKKKKNNRQVN